MSENRDDRGEVQARQAADNNSPNDHSHFRLRRVYPERHTPAPETNMSEWPLFLALLLNACASPTEGSARDRTPSDAGDGPDAVALVGTWLGPAVQSSGDQYIAMHTANSGTAALWWYGAFATWSVRANDDGNGDATLNLSCTSPPCVDDQPIAYDCVYTQTELSCLGIAGGRDNSHRFAATGRTAPDVFVRARD